MAKSGDSKGAKTIRPFDEKDTKLAMGQKVIKIPSVTILEQLKSGKVLDRRVKSQKLYGRPDL